MPPQGIDMGPILAALKMRQQGALGGGGTPMQQQASPQAPMQTPGQAPMPSPGAMPSQVQQGAGQSPVNGQLQAGQKAQGPQFDDETRLLAKSLVQRLLKGI